MVSSPAVQQRSWVGGGGGGDDRMGICMYERLGTGGPVTTSLGSSFETACDILYILQDWR